jgi:hypothetical protein
VKTYKSLLKGKAQEKREGRSGEQKAGKRDDRPSRFLVGIWPLKGKHFPKGRRKNTHVSARSTFHYSRSGGQT